MSYPWTRVPAGQPPLDKLQRRLLPIADLFMALMWSRPGGLSLRTTWVTPATLGLSVAVLLVAIPAGLTGMVIGIRDASPLLIAGGGVAALLGLGAASVAVYGIRQRLLDT